MGRGLRAIWLGITDGYGELFSVVGMNVIWFLLSLPLGLLGASIVQISVTSMAVSDEARSLIAAVGFSIVIWMLSLGPNPAAGGLHLFANRLVNEERVEFGLFWEGLRAHWRAALGLFAIGSVGVILLFANALFYLRSDLTPLRIFGIVWVYSIYFWLSMQIYMLPLLVAQDDKRIRVVLRNAFFISMGNVFPTFVVFLFCAVLALASFALALLMFLLAGSIFALIEARLLNLNLERIRQMTASR